MAQDLKSISYESFKIQLFKIPVGTLKNLVKTIQDFKAENFIKMDMEGIKDILRKESAIQAELIRRGYYKKTDHGEWNEWYKNHKKKRIF